jgi:hypothetical protein
MLLKKNRRAMKEKKIKLKLSRLLPQFCEEKGKTLDPHKMSLFSISPVSQTGQV